MRNKDCKGCLAQTDNCVIEFMDFECPCRKCIVKVTCEDVCDDLKRAANKANEEYTPNDPLHRN